MGKRMTICKMHISLMRLLKKNKRDNPQTIELLKKALEMGKAMSKQLVKYKKYQKVEWKEQKRGWIVDINIDIVKEVK